MSMNMERLKAYELLQQEQLRDIKSNGIYLRHKKTGAKLLLLENEDENKVFYVGFRTPVSDNTGVPHIVEHSVLCGSRNFPVKDPFVELAKGSLNTFLNAMTYPDKTVYPVASCNDKDFQNLIHVYMDAVFYPNIYQQEEIFRQEGWSYQLESTDGPLTYNGVVYNEMKGAFSSPDGVLDRVILNSLFPDTNYAFESGGDPQEIPQLTYEAFLDFHRTYYHPSNSYFYLYGKMDFEEKLLWLDEQYLSHFSYQEIFSEIPFQKPFSAIKKLTMPYSIGVNEPETQRAYLSYNKVIPIEQDAKKNLAYQILDYVLLSAPGAVLKKALIEKGIGKSITGGYDGGILQPIFSVIAKGANEEQTEEFLAVIEETLQKLVQDGIKPKALEAGLNYYEFRYREADYGSSPRGLIYGLQVLDSWLYDDTKPFLHLQESSAFSFLKKQLETEYFQELIQELLLENSHGSVVVLKPEKGRATRQEQQLCERLESYRKSLSSEELYKLKEKTEALEAYQREMSSQEELKKIPLLSISDIGKEPMPVCNEEMKVGTTPLLYHEVETGGIGYVDLLFDLSGIREDLLPYVGVLQRILGIIDTSHYEYGELIDEMNCCTGGLEISLEVYPDVERCKEKEFKATLELKVKALYEKLPFAMEMVREILMESRLEDEKRLKEILAMITSGMRERFLSAGHTAAVLRAQSYASPIAKFRDLTDGIAFYQTVRHLEEHFQEEKGLFITTLKELVRRIFRGDRLLVSYTSAREGLKEMPALIRNLQEELCQEELEQEKDEECCILHCQKENEGFQTASKVQYVARAGSFVEKGFSYSGVLQVLKVILGYEYLWQNIRVIGGAYGCMSGFSRIGEGFLTSYRDPHLRRTNQVYEELVSYLETFEAKEREMTKFIIGAISNLDHPLTPAAKGERSLNLYMTHVSMEMLQKERAEVLHATKEDIRKTAELIKAILSANQFCVIGAEEKIAQAKEMFLEVKELF